jgi:uncharacterized protein YcbX
MADTLHVSLLSVTPVKGLGLHHPHAVELTEEGVAGDRDFFLVDVSGEMVSCTDIGALMAHRAEYDPATGVLALHGPHGPLRSATVELGEPIDTDFYGERTVTGRLVVGWDDVFSAVAGQPVRLVQGDTGAFDVAGLTLVGGASTEALAESNALGSVDGRRFRMNVEIAGSAPLAEDSWDGRELRIGDAVVRAGGPVRRCAATTRNPDTGVVDLQTLRLIGAYKGRQESARFGAGFYFGIYADVRTPGSVSIGDAVTFL